MKAGEVLVALRGSLATGQSELADIWSAGHYDYIWIDGQHTPFAEHQLVSYCAAAEELGIDNCASPTPDWPTWSDAFWILDPARFWFPR